jgi:uncharacterized membrane protein YgcG
VSVNPVQADLDSAAAEDVRSRKDERMSGNPSFRLTGDIASRARLQLGGWLLLAVCLVLATAVPALAVVPEVQDGAGFFKPEAIAKANDELAEIGRRFKKDLLIETYATVPADKVAAVKAMDKEGRTKFFQEWANSRAKRRRVEGIYVLISKDPAHIQVEVGRQTEKAAFTIEDRNRLREILVDAFQKKEFDRGLLDGVQYVEKTLEEHRANEPARRAR